MSKTAILIGASGLVGNELLSLLLRDDEYINVKLFVRKFINVNHSKLEQIEVDFDHVQDFEQKIQGDVVFCCIGTTIKNAGSKEAFIKVDYSIPFNIATIAKKNNIAAFVIISSLGANKVSSNFYLKTKGEIEQALQNLVFKKLVIVRPSLLLGNRTEFRLGEVIGKFTMKLISVFFIGRWRKYRAIKAKTVAKAMIVLANKNEEGVKIVESDILEMLGK